MIAKINEKVPFIGNRVITVSDIPLAWLITGVNQVVNESNKVTQWFYKNVFFSRNIESAKPTYLENQINGLPSTQFMSNSAQYLMTESPLDIGISDRVWIFVARNRGKIGDSEMYGKGEGNGRHSVGFRNGELRMVLVSNVGTQHVLSLSGTNYNDTGYKIYTYYINRDIASMGIRVNKDTIGTLGIGPITNSENLVNTNQPTLGARSGLNIFNGDIAEVVFLTNYQSMIFWEDYLINKYAL